MLIGFIRTERLYDDFTRRARVFFNNTRPTTTPTEPRAPVSIEKSSEALLGEWRNFVASFLGVLGRNIVPLFAFLSDRLSYLAQMLQALENLYKEPQPLMAIRPIRRVKNMIDALKIEAIQLGQAISAYAQPGFDIDDVARRLGRLDHGIRALFPDIIPKNSLIIGGTVGTKRELLIACDNVIEVTDGIKCFDKQSGEVTDAILAMDEAFNGLFAVLGIPIPKKGTSPSDVSDTTPKTQPIQNCDRMQQRIAQMQTAIADASGLFKTKT
jgi:hypothetical protein